MAAFAGALDSWGIRRSNATWQPLGSRRRRAKSDGLSTPQREGSTAVCYQNPSGAAVWRFASLEPSCYAAFRRRSPSRVDIDFDRYGGGGGELCRSVGITLSCMSSIERSTFR